MHVSDHPKYWDNINALFYKKYNGIDTTHKQWADLVVNGKPIEGPFGRSWKIDLKRDRFGNIKIPWTTLSNYPVQGTGADIMMIVRIVFFNRVKKANIPCDFVSTVHDSIVVDCPSKYLQQLVNLFHSVFEDLPRIIHQQFGYSWSVPMACECKYGPNMKDMTKISRTY